MQLALLWVADLNGALSKRHIKIYIDEFQETVFNVVQEVMVSLGSRKIQGQKRYTLIKQWVIFFSLRTKIKTLYC